MTRVAFALACASALATAAWTAEPFDGRWAADSQACESESDNAAMLVVDSVSLRWRESACTIRTSYRVRDLWHIGARCWADGATGNVPITLRMRGERLMLDWAGAPAQELRRCP